MGPTNNSRRFRRMKSPSLREKIINGSAELDMARASLRIDSLQTYAIISSIIMGSSIGLFGIGMETDYSAAGEDERNVWQKILLTSFYYCSSLSVISSSYTAVTFMLCALYFSTALGMGGDECFANFDKSTSNQRKTAFNAFVASVLSFMLSFVILVFFHVSNHLNKNMYSSVLENFLPVLILVLTLWAFYVFSQIIRMATNIIFDPLFKKADSALVERSHIRRSTRGLLQTTTADTSPRTSFAESDIPSKDKLVELSSMRRSAISLNDETQTFKDEMPTSDTNIPRFKRVSFEGDDSSGTRPPPPEPDRVRDPPVRACRPSAVFSDRTPPDQEVQHGPPVHRETCDRDGAPPRKCIQEVSGGTRAVPLTSMHERAVSLAASAQLDSDDSTNENLCTTIIFDNWGTKGRTDETSSPSARLDNREPTSPVEIHKSMNPENSARLGNLDPNGSGEIHESFNPWNTKIVFDNWGGTLENPVSGHKPVDIHESTLEKC